MRIVVAPDKFAGTATASEAARAIAAGWSEIRPDDEVIVSPMADGGPGTIDCVHGAGIGVVETHTTVDPLGRPVEARWLRIDGDTALVESAEAVGIHLIEPSRRDVSTSTSEGLGLLLSHLHEIGVRHLVVGLGGSATCDGGVGMAAALGIRFLRADGEPADLAPEHMGTIESVTGETPEFETVRIISDVTNPLLGPEGAPRAFGPQKGASPRQIEAMERALAQLADSVEAGNQSFRDRPGAGAAGGVGFALMAWLDGVMESGATYVADVTGLPARISSADLVITGEGHIDRQSMHGKVPSHVLSLARAASVPVLAVAGRIDPDVATEFATSVELGDAGLIDPIGSMSAAGETAASLMSSI